MSGAPRLSSTSSLFPQVLFDLFKLLKCGTEIFDDCAFACGKPRCRFARNCGDHGCFKSSVIAAHCSSAPSKSSMISRAMTAGGGKVGGVFEGVVLQPEDVEVHLVALDELVVSERFEAVSFFAGVA